MMERIIVIINWLSLILFALSLCLTVVLAFRRRISADTGVYLSLMAGILVFINFSNIMEHLGVTGILDYYEDFVEMLLPFFFIIFLNSIRLHADIERRAGNERELGSMLAERDELLKEIHHRVKNNLQLVISLLNLQYRQHDGEGNPDLTLPMTANRIFSMAAVHEIVYQAGSYSSIPAGGFIRSIVSQSFRNVVEGNDGKISMYCDIDDGINVRLEIAVPLGLLVNELIANACRYAFIGRERGTVKLTFRRDEGMILLELKDDGIGMPVAPDGGEITNLSSMLIGILAGQINGGVTTVVEGGTAIAVRFPG